MSQPNPALSSEGAFVSQQNIDQLCINTIRTLSIDAVQTGQLRPSRRSHGSGSRGLFLVAEFSSL